MQRFIKSFSSPAGYVSTSSAHFPDEHVEHSNGSSITNPNQNRVPSVYAQGVQPTEDEEMLSTVPQDNAPFAPEDPETSEENEIPSNGTSFVTQLFATIRRHLIQKRRSWRSCALEMVLPLLFVVGLIIIANVSKVEKFPAAQFVNISQPRYIGMVRFQTCYNGPTASPELKEMLPDCQDVADRRIICARKGLLPVDGFCVMGGYNTVLGLGYLISGFDKEIEIANLDDMIILKWMVKTMVPDDDAIFQTLDTFTSLKNMGNLYFIPENRDTHRLTNWLNITHKLYKYVHGGYFNSREEALPYVKDVANEGKVWALIDVKSMAVNKLDIVISTNRSGIPTLENGVREQFPVGLASKAYGKYYGNGFLTLQKMMYDYHLTNVLSVTGNDLVASDSPTFLTMVPMGLTRYKTSEFLELAAQLGPLVLVLAFLYPVSQLAKRLVEEKELRLREGTMIMGLTKTAFFSSWLLIYYVQMILAALLVTVVQKLAVTTETDFFIIFFTYIIFVFATINMAAMFSTFFSRAQIAALVVPLIYFVVSIPAFAMPDGTTPVAFHALSIFCPTPLAVALRLQFGYEVNRGIGWQDFVNDQDDPYNYLISLIWMIGDAVFYLIVMLYLDSVLPKEWGTTRHPLFFLRSKRKGGIWCCGGRRDKHSSDDSDDKEMGDMEFDNPARFMTRTPSHYAVQDYPMSNADSTVNIQKLRKEFPAHGNAAKPVALDDLHLRLFPDGITVLLGHNGAGKTTVMNMMTGMMNPTGGDVHIYGKSILSNMQGIRRDIGFCPQHNILWDDLTCMEHLQYFARLKGMSGADVDSEAEEMLGRVDLLEKRDVLSKNLSGGQKRKLSVAIAFMGRARLVLLDEPTAGMDVAARRHTWDVLKEMSKGRTILLTTHYMDEADLLGSRIAIMSKGSLHSYGTPMYLKNNLGTGYVMKVACEHAIQDPTPILDNVRAVIPNALIKECKGQELSISLPKADVRDFPDAIRQLEANRTKFGVKSISMSVATLEVVFLNIADRELQGTLSEDQYAEDEASKNTEAFAALESVYVKLQKENEERLLTGENKHATNAPLTRQVAGMLRKRANYARRDYCALSLQILAPMVCIVVAMLLGLIEPTTPPVTYFDNRMYGDVKQMVSTNNCGEMNNWFDRNFDRVDAQAISDSYEFSRYLLNSYKKHGKRERMVSFGCRDRMGNNVLFVNSTSLVSGPQAMLQFYRARARRDIQAWNVGLHTASNPLPFSAREETKITAISAMLTAVFILIPFTFIPSTYVAFIVKERQCKSKHLQFVSGANYVAYWLGNFIFDFLSYLVTVAIAFIIFAAFQRKEFIGDSEAALCVLVLFLLYGLSGIGAAYLVSNFFSNHSTAQTVVMLANFMTGFILVVVMFFLQNISNTKSAARTLVFFTRIIPPYCLGEGFMNMAISHALIPVRGPKSPFEMDIAGWDLLYMGIESLAFFVLAAFLDHPIRHRRQALMQFRGGDEAPLVEDEDEDVRMEREEVEKGQRGADIVLVKRLHKVHSVNGGDKVAVRNLSFGVKQGEVFGFLGTNGAGKTTTMSMLTTEIVPTCGQASVGGFDVVRQSAETRRLIGYCPQFDAIIDLLTPEEHLRLFAALRGIDKSSVGGVIDALIKTCSLESYRHVPSGKLSGGNKRKLSVAMALIGGPSIVLLDEPSAGMDPQARRQLWDVISFVAKHSSVLLTTHHLEEVDVLAHRVGIMDKGLLKCLGTLEHLKHKFGNGYELTIQLKDESQAEEAVRFVSQNYPTAVLVEARQQRLLFTLPFNSTDLATLFQTIQKAVDGSSVGIADYTVQQTSLEQVFLRISALGAEHNPHNGSPIRTVADQHIEATGADEFEDHNYISTQSSTHQYIADSRTTLSATNNTNNGIIIPNRNPNHFNESNNNSHMVSASRMSTSQNPSDIYAASIFNRSNHSNSDRNR